MNASVVVALAGVIVTVLIAVFGGIIGHLVGRVNKLQDARDVDRKSLQDARDSDRREHEARVAILEQALDAKQETIEELRRQNQRLTITAELQDKFFGGLPRLNPAQPVRGEGT